MGKKTVKLATGYEMPLIGFGLWKVGNDTCADTVYNAIKVGYRCFDGAYDYGNEIEAGKGVRRAIEDGLVKREELFITTKLWNNYHRRENALKMGREQLKMWGLDYFDLYLMHFPIALKYIDPEVLRYPGWWMNEAQDTVEEEDVPVRETWEALEELADAGVARSIGVSNFQSSLLHDVLRYARHPVAALQVEHHPYLAQPGLIAFAQEHGIAVTGYSTFGPASFRELPETFSKVAKDTPVLFEAEPVVKAAKAHNVTPSQVLLRWPTQRGVAVIPKSNNPDRLRQNLEVTEFDLSQEELDEISALDRGLRFNDPALQLPMHPLRIFA